MSSCASSPGIKEWIEKELIERGVEEPQETAVFVVGAFEECSSESKTEGGDESPWTRFKRVKHELTEKLASCFKDGDGLDIFVHRLLTKTIGQAPANGGDGTGDSGEDDRQEEVSMQAIEPPIDDELGKFVQRLLSETGGGSSGGDGREEKAPTATMEDGELKSPITNNRAPSPTQRAYIASPEREFLGYFGRGPDESEGSNRGGLFTAVEWAAPVEKSDIRMPAPSTIPSVWAMRESFPERGDNRPPAFFNNVQRPFKPQPSPWTSFGMPRQQFDHAPQQTIRLNVDLTRPPPSILSLLGNSGFRFPGGGGPSLRPSRPPARLPCITPTSTQSPRMSCDQDGKRRQLLERVHKRTELYAQLKSERDEMEKKASRAAEGSERQQRFLKAANRLGREMRNVKDEIHLVEGHVKDIDKVRAKKR